MDKQNCLIETMHITQGYLHVPCAMRIAFLLPHRFLDKFKGVQLVFGIRFSAFRVAEGLRQLLVTPYIT